MLRKTDKYKKFKNKKQKRTLKMKTAFAYETIATEDERIKVIDSLLGL
jgi:hypothetical protein